MKNILLVLALAVIFPAAKAQNTFKTAFNNSGDNTIEISISIDEVEVVGSTGNEIIIESIGEKNPNYKNPPKEEPRTDVPDRAKGLKPVGSMGTDNTGLGMAVEKTEKHVKISSGARLSSDKFKITIPNKVKLIIHDMHPFGHAKYNYTISNMEDEITVHSMNSNFKLQEVKGPLVLNTINGNVETVYSAITTTKPISIVTVNGFVDLTIPAATKANLELQTINGEAYTDFDVKPTEEGSKAIPNVGNLQMFHLNGMINGGGGVKININSVNGDIYLRKK